MRTRITLEGEREIMDALKAMETAVSTEIIREAVMDAMEPVRERAAQLAPRRSGQLAGDIVKEIVDARPGFVAGHVGPGKRGFYGLYQEFGWRAAGRRKAKEGGGTRVPPRPFLRPAIEQMTDAALAAFTRAVRAALDRVR